MMKMKDMLQRYINFNYCIELFSRNRKGRNDVKKETMQISERINKNVL